MDSQSPFVDHAAPILAGDPAITDEQRADLWDVFNKSKDHNELAQHLQDMTAVPDDTKQALFDAKKKAIPPVEPLDKVTAAIARIKQIPPDVLEMAESHPNVLKAITSAATTPEKGAGEPAGAGKPAAKGKTAAAGAKPAPLAQPPRPDGLEHLPPIPDGHHRVLASDGGLHDIPAENIEQARAIDPRLHVLNP